MEYCDDCGGEISPGIRYVVESLPCDIASANTGESATMCRECFTKFLGVQSCNGATSSV